MNSAPPLTRVPAGITICKDSQMRRVANANRRTAGMRQQLSNFKAEFFKALAHPLRISILDALRDGELTVNQISETFGVEPANASQQLSVLRTRGIVTARKEGSNVYYSASAPAIFKVLDAAREIFNSHLSGVRGMLEEIQKESRGIARRSLAARRRPK